MSHCSYYSNIEVQCLNDSVYIYSTCIQAITNCMKLYENDVFKHITMFPSNRLILSFETYTTFYCFCMFSIELVGSGSCNITSKLSL